MKKKKTFSRYEHIKQVRNPAYAPYNFVPLNQKIVVINPEIPEANKYHTNRNTGWIELEIETLTPLYIRGTLTKDEILAGKESKDKPDFFSPADRVRIPGSSLRGMTRNLVEIVSYGRFHFSDDKRLYYRGLADRSNLRDEYQRKMSSYDRRRRRRKSKYKFSAGILRKTKHADRGEHFEIVSSGDNFKQILKSKAKADIKAIGKKYREFEFYEIEEGYIAVSGNIPGKKRDWLIYPPQQNAEIIKLDNKDIQDYLGDRNRSENVPNLINLARKRDKGVPCFYVRWKDEEGNDRVSFGHTGFFRLAYEKTIGEHIFEELFKTGKIDFTESIFGNETTHAGRLFFEDAFLAKGQENPLLEEQIPQILSEPKPTTFQHYLVQNSDEVRQLNHYNSDTVIRGYKMFWHKSGENWQETDKDAIEKHSTQYTLIQPVKSGTKFKSKIRFENLSDEELGALLFALELPPGCAHKLGMGKPLGLGSVKITPSLYLSNREQRYRDFFAEWNNQISIEDNDSIKELKGNFEKYVLNDLGESIDKSLWETERLKELLVMLNVGIGRELEKNGLIRYMSIIGQNEFKDRPVLPLASSIPEKDIVRDAVNKALDKKKEEPTKIIKNITKVEIKGIWGSHNVLWEPYYDVNILAGVNGSGKSTLMDIIHAALKHDFTELKIIPDLIKITFDTAEILEYHDKKLIKKPKSEIKFDYISTFDRKIGAVSFSDASFKDIYDTELMRELQTKLDQFTRLLKTLLDNPQNTEAIKEAKSLQTTLKSWINHLFEPLRKEIIFSKSFELNEKSIEKLSEGKLPTDLLNKLKSMKGVKFIPEKEFTNKLKLSISAEIVDRYKDFIFSAGELSKEQYILFVKTDGKLIKPHQLSSGEKQILLILLSVILQRNTPHILLMDEPEISLHPDWQEELISMIRDINKNAQVILVTHSPALVIKNWFGQIIDIEDIFQPGGK